MDVRDAGVAQVIDRREHQVRDHEQREEQAEDPRPRRGAQQVIRVGGERHALDATALDERAAARIDEALRASVLLDASHGGATMPPTRA